MGRFRSLLQDWSNARRFHAPPSEQRAIVFYAEDGDSWPHFEPIVRELTGPMGRTICYLTSSRNDPVLQLANPRIHAFCIGEGFIQTSLFMSLQAGVCVMTMPDIEAFHLKRSRRAPVHYVYLFHSMVSTHMIYRQGAFDHYDTILCVGPHHVREIRATEAAYNLPPKELIEHGYGRLDTLLAGADKAECPSLSSCGTGFPFGSEPQGRRQPVDFQGSGAGSTADCPPGSPHVLIAPSWGSNGLLETRGAEVVRILLAAGCRVTVRPHPMTRRRRPCSIRRIEAERATNPRLTIEDGVASHASLEAADVMISDWSGAALEFAFAYERPVLFIDVPRKVNNPEYERLACEPLEVSIRKRIGRVIGADRQADLPAAVRKLCDNPGAMRDQIVRAREEYVYNVGRSGTVGAEAIASIADSVATGSEGKP